MPYAAPAGGKLAKILSYTLGFATTAIELVRKRRHFDLLHLTPLYRQFLYAEALLCAIAWALGKRVVLDIRAGSFVIALSRAERRLSRSRRRVAWPRREGGGGGQGLSAFRAGAARGTDPLFPELR